MKKIFLFIMLFLLVAIGIFSIITINNKADINNDSNSISPDEIETNNTTVTNDDSTVIEYQIYFDNIMSGGPPKDGIPPIEEPLYISLDEADGYLDDKDKVFIYESEEGVFMYPQRILVWHEIVNDNISGENISITYCPLTGSAICYLGDIADFHTNTYGTSGKLLNSNLVMYDRDSDSYIPQILGVGINNDLEGIPLKTSPIYWANWEDAKSKYKEARILSTETGFLRDYYSDPYGTYLPDDEKSYYYFGSPFFPLMSENDGTFSDKKVVVGVKHMNAVVALDPFFVKGQLLVNFEIASDRAVAFYDKSLKTVRVFLSTIDNESLVFEYMENKIYDQRGVEWYVNGNSENGEILETPIFFDVMWFAWHAFYPDTEVIK